MHREHGSYTDFLKMTHNNQENETNNYGLKNIGFKFIHELFIYNGWNLINNDLNRVSYTKKGFETDVFDIFVDRSRISVAIPVKKSPYQYRTYFTDYYQATEYIEERFLEFNQKS